MSFVIYHKETTVILQEPGKRWYNNTYATEAAAKAGLTRAIKKSKAPRKPYQSKREPLKREDYAISDYVTFKKSIEKKVTKRNLMSGEEFESSVNEPLCTDPSSETYWSM